MSNSSKRSRAGGARPAQKQKQGAAGRPGDAAAREAAGAAGTAGAPGKAAGAAGAGKAASAVRRAAVSPASAGKPVSPAGGAAEGPEGTAGGTPTLRLTLAAGVAAVEGLAVAAWGIGTCFTGGSNAVPAGLLLLVFAAIPLFAAYGLRKARRWSRGPALIMQLISLPLAWTMLGSGGPAIPAGIALGVLALTAAVLLVHPAATDALGIKRTASS
ncbi:hypothetical protein [Streptomyces sp. HPF1205]|uniref:hypothetical protein n=1 Tax=Streptomyces sp. HPF1205 TaxID=2873262 RepID=UPI001CED16F7|nr:hypothetical protein [Streptomyces sp. HPF1205]